MTASIEPLFVPALDSLDELVPHEGLLTPVELEDVAGPDRDGELLALDAALVKLAVEKPDHAKLIELRYFAGLSGDEAAAALGVSPATADRRWRFVRAWLQIELQQSD